MSVITPYLWFESNEGLEAAELYTKLFPNSEITNVNRMGDDSFALTVDFTLDGQKYTALNGGPHESPTDAVSFSVLCADQAEVDHYWSALTENGGKEVQCGWLKDRWGFSWQIVPQRFFELLSDPDPARVQRTMDAMMQMVKLDVAALEAAADGTATADSGA